jgi:GT2 family glycosyltransferase
VIQKISAAKPAPAMQRWEKSFGVPHSNPKVSMVIPLYGRYDFIQFQLSQFCNDPDLKDVEIIYVIDDPSIFNAVVMFSNQLFPIFHMPFRLVYSGNNLGFSGANNFGVSHAIAPYILLLNSDIIPKEKGWLTRLLDHYKKLPGCGILGPTLLYEDKSIQHAGMKFGQYHFLEGFWLNEHPGKGIPVWLADTGSKPKPMPAVTGACMLISKELYNQVGGFDESYILGDFEDSDLCLKIRKMNLKCYYIPEVSLYHLERKSQSLFSDHNWKYKVTLYNGWLHTKRWGKIIESINAL